MVAKKPTKKAPPKRKIEREEKPAPEAVEADVVESKAVQVSDPSIEVMGESGLTNKQVGVLRKTLMKDFTADEMGLTFHMAKAIGANIFARELWAFKDNKGNLVNVIARDFLRKKAYENPEFVSFASGSVFEKDEFEIDQANGVVVHKVKNAFDLKKRGPLLGAWCIGTFRDGQKVAYLARLDVYKPDKPNFYSPWSGQDEDMIIKCAESVIFKKFAKLGNVYTEEEAAHLRHEQPERIERPSKPDIRKMSALTSKQCTE